MWATRRINFEETYNEVGLVSRIGLKKLIYVKYYSKFRRNIPKKVSFED